MRIKYLKEQQEFERLKERRQKLLAKKSMQQMSNVKLQAELIPEVKRENINERVFVQNLPNEIKSYIGNVVDNELTKFSTELKYEEGRVLNSISLLKVVF